jgi:hypothetical protein
VTDACIGEITMRFCSLEFRLATAVSPRLLVDAPGGRTNDDEDAGIVSWVYIVIQFTRFRKFPLLFCYSKSRPWLWAE